MIPINPGLVAALVSLLLAGFTGSEG